MFYRSCAVTDGDLRFDIDFGRCQLLGWIYDQIPGIEDSALRFFGNTSSNLFALAGRGHSLGACGYEIGSSDSGPIRLGSAIVHKREE